MEGTSASRHWRRHKQAPRRLQCAAWLQSFATNASNWLLLKILIDSAGSLSLNSTGVVSHLSPSRCTPLTSRNEHGSSRRGGLRPLQRCVRSSAPPFTFTPLLFNICQAICPRHCSPQATCRVMRRLPSLTIDERLTHCRIHLQTPARVAERKEGNAASQAR